MMMPLNRACPARTSIPIPYLNRVLDLQAELSREEHYRAMHLMHAVERVLIATESELESKSGSGSESLTMATLPTIMMAMHRQEESGHGQR